MKNTKFHISEIFPSIEGEGKRTGYMSTFVRFTGCNLRCSYCDTTYALHMGEDDSEVLTEDEALIAGKIVLPYRNIKHVHAEKGKGFDVVTLTMNQGGLQFKTSNGVALKEVMDEMIEESKEKVLISSNSENSPQEKLHTDLEQQEPVKIEKSPFEKIKEAKELLDMGALTQDEFDEIKRKALDMLR